MSDLPDTNTKPLIVQGADTLLLEVASPLFEEARAHLMTFAELVKAPQHVHTYRVTALSVWNARASGAELSDMLATLQRYSRYEVPASFEESIRAFAARYGRLKLLRIDDELTLEASDSETLDLAAVDREVRKWLGPRKDRLRYSVARHTPSDRQAPAVWPIRPANSSAATISRPRRCPGASEKSPAASRVFFGNR